MILFDYVSGFICFDPKLIGQFIDAHAVHHAEVYGLCLFTRDLCHLCDHRMEVCLWIRVVHRHKLFGSAERAISVLTKYMCVMHQDPWFLLREVYCSPLVPFFR